MSIDADLVRRIKAITNVFEVGRPDPDYSYIENLDDGRGFTLTHYGFCTYNDEVEQVIKAYTDAVGDNPLAHCPSKGLAKAWKQAARDPALAKACDAVADDLYLKPALALAADAGVTSPVGLAIFYDTMVQHGDGDDPDSLLAIMKQAKGSDDYLAAFLDARGEILGHAHDPDTREVWRQSRGRVAALRKLLKSNPQLAYPIKIDQGDGEVITVKS